MLELQIVARYLVFGVFVASVLVAFGSWLVRTRRLSPFGPVGRALRAATDPVLRPVETRLVRLGGNPVHAGWWLVVSVAALGVVFLGLFNRLVAAAYGWSVALAAGPRAVLAVLIHTAYTVVFIALLFRVLASWFGFFRYARWMRPAYWLTDWLVEPIQRLLPPMGMVDWSPLIAWLALWLLEQLLLSALRF